MQASVIVCACAVSEKLTAIGERRAGESAAITKLVVHVLIVLIPQLL